MFIEIRKQGKKKKYYLVHTYRSAGKVKRISKYLGSDIDDKELQKLKSIAEKRIIEDLKERNILEFELNDDEIKYYTNYDSKIKIKHLQGIDWTDFKKRFTYDTNAIEGSTVTLIDAEELLGQNKKPINNDELETVSVSESVDFIRNTQKKMSIELIKEIHNICFNKTKPFAGKIRDVPVVIKDSYGNIIHEGAPVDLIDKLLTELCVWYEKHIDIYPPLLISALVHNQFENIHPFQDGNGRVGRLLLNYVLIKHNYPPINILLEDRDIYYGSLKHFDDNGNIVPTLKFLIKLYKKQYNIS